MIGTRRCGALRRGPVALVVLLSFWCVSATAAAPPTHVGQDADGPETLAKLALEQLADGLDDYDLDAIETAIVDLDSVYAKVSPKTLTKVVKGLASVLDQEVRHEERFEGPTPEDELLPSYQLTIGILYDKPEGQKVLVDALKQRHVKAWPDVQALILEALGFRVEAQNVPLLAAYLDDADSRVVVAAANALGQYSESDQELRKQAVKALIAAYGAHGRAAEKERKKGKSEEAQAFLVLVEGAFNQSLVALTRQRFGEPSSWQAWFDDNGASDW